MPEFNIVTVDSQPILYVHRSSATDPQSIGACMGEAFGTLMGFLGENGIDIAGAPMSIYHGFDADKATFDVALPVTEADTARAEGHADIKGGATHAGQALKAVHVGPYNKLADTYNGIMAHMQKEGLEPVGPCWEVYMNDPDTTPEDKLVTEIYFPIG